MGICQSNQGSKTISMHVTIFQAKSGENIDEAEEDDLVCNEFLIESSGYLIVPGPKTSNFNTFAWTKNFGSNSLTRSCIVARFGLENGRDQPYFSNASNIPDYSNAIWNILSLVDNAYVTEGNLVEPDDVLRIGDQIICFRLIELIKQKPFKDLSRSGRKVHFQDGNEEKGHSRPRPCGTCKSQDETNTNPLIKPCMCSSSGYFHLQCLSNKVLSKCSVEEFNHIISYDYSDVLCEKCGNQLMTTAMVEGVSVPIVNPEVRAKFAFFFLEVFELKAPFNIRYVLILNLEKHSMINLGRSDENELIFDDRTVSLFHGSIDIREDGLFFIDKSSGSNSYLLVRGKSPIETMTFYLFKVGNFIVEIHPIFDTKCICFSQGLIYETEPYQAVKELLENQTNTPSQAEILSPTIRDGRSPILNRNLRVSIPPNKSFHGDENFSDSVQEANTLFTLAITNQRKSIRFTPSDEHGSLMGNLAPKQSKKREGNQDNDSELHARDKTNRRRSMLTMPHGGAARASIMKKSHFTKKDSDEYKPEFEKVRRSIIGRKSIVS